MLCISTDVLCCNSASWLICTKFGTSVTPLYGTPTSSSFLIPLLAVQPSVNLSLFHSCPPLLSVLQLKSPVPHTLVLSIFLNWLKPPQLRFSYTSRAFWFKNSQLSARYSYYFLQRCPSHLSLPVFITLTMSGSFRAYKAHYCSLFSMYHYHK